MLHRSRTFIEVAGSTRNERSSKLELCRYQVADLIPLLWAISGAKECDEDDHARHDQRGEGDDVTIGDKVMMRSSERPSTERRRSNVANGAGQSG